jgi:hypothetical protein
MPPWQYRAGKPAIEAVTAVEGRDDMAAAGDGAFSQPASRIVRAAP